MWQLLDLLGFLFAIGCPTILLIVGLCLTVWHFSTRADRKLQREMKQVEIQALRQQTALATADANGNYPLPIELLANPEVLQQLLSIALTQQTVKRARKNVPNHYSVVNKSETDQQLTMTGQQFDASKLLNDSRSSDVMALLTSEE